MLAGVSYKANVSDQRETPAKPLVAHLRAMGAEVSYVDSHVDVFFVAGIEVSKVPNVHEAASRADIVVVLQAHEEFLETDVLTGADCVLDISGCLEGDNVERL